MKRLVPLGTILVALSIPAAAQADVQVLSSEGDELASFKSAACKKGSKKLLSFTALAKSRGARRFGGWGRKLQGGAEPGTHVGWPL